MAFESHKIELDQKGFSIIPSIYSLQERNAILQAIEEGNIGQDALLKTRDLFAIRQLLNHIPNLKHLLFTTRMKQLLNNLGAEDYFLTKAIYFNKPAASNWFVAYHQDLSVSVNEKADLPGYNNWTFKKGQYGVQPPINILENIITLRIHLDDTTHENGALRVIPASHKRGIIRINEKDWDTNQEETCKVSMGGVMLMKPLTLHASSKSTNNNKRRVIHLELSNKRLQDPLEWLEFLNIDN